MMCVSSEDFLQNLDEILTKNDEAGMRLNHSKCSFVMSKIEYLDHVIDEHGIHPTEDKVKTIQEAPRPINVSELRSFIGIGGIRQTIRSKLSKQQNRLSKLIRWFITMNTFL